MECPQISIVRFIKANGLPLVPAKRRVAYHFKSPNPYDDVVQIIVLVTKVYSLRQGGYFFVSVCSSVYIVDVWTLCVPRMRLFTGWSV